MPINARGWCRSAGALVAASCRWGNRRLGRRRRARERQARSSKRSERLWEEFVGGYPKDGRFEAGRFFSLQTLVLTRCSRRQSSSASHRFLWPASSRIVTNRFFSCVRCTSKRHFERHGVVLVARTATSWPWRVVPGAALCNRREVTRSAK